MRTFIYLPDGDKVEVMKLKTCWGFSIHYDPESDAFYTAPGPMWWRQIKNLLTRLQQKLRITFKTYSTEDVLWYHRAQGRRK